MTPSQVMGNACGAGSSGAVREQRAKEGAAEKMSEWLRDDTEAMDCPRFRGPISSLKS